MCVDNCGHSRESRVDIQITTSNADYLLPVGLLAVLVYAMLFWYIFIFRFIIQFIHLPYYY